MDGVGRDGSDMVVDDGVEWGDKFLRGRRRSAKRIYVFIYGKKSLKN